MFRFGQNRHDFWHFHSSAHNLKTKDNREKKLNQKLLQILLATNVKLYKNFIEGAVFEINRYDLFVSL